MALQKTSIQVDSSELEQLEKLYPDLTRSEIIRLSIKFVLETQPRLQQACVKFVMVDSK